MSINSPFTTKKERGMYTAIVYKEGSSYIAEDNVGKVIIEGTDASTVIQKAIDDYAEHGYVLIVPAVTITATIKILKSWSVVKFLGKITSTGVDGIVFGDATHYPIFSTLELPELNGGDNSAKGIVFKRARGCEIRFGLITEHSIGLSFEAGASQIISENYIEGGDLRECDTAGIRFAATAGGMQGNHFRMAIFVCAIGYETLSGGDSLYQTFDGVIDCKSYPGGGIDIKDDVGRQLFMGDFVRRSKSTIGEHSLLLCPEGGRMGHPVVEMRDGIAEMINIGLTPHLMWDFDRDSTGDWTKANCTMGTPSKSVTRITPSTGGNYISRDIVLDGGQAQLVAIRYKYISGTVEAGRLYWGTSGHGFSGDYKEDIPTLLTDGEWHVLVRDMSHPTAGGTDWIDNTITSFRYDAVLNQQGILDIDYIAICGRGYTSMYHMDDALKTPASAAAVGNKGDIRWDASYIYICTAKDTWKRAAIGTW